VELRESLKTGEKQKQIWTSFPAFSNIWRSARAKDVNVNIRTSQFRRLRTLVSGISYLRLCVYHRHLDSFKASWKQYFFARPTRHDSARSWLLRQLELRLIQILLLTKRSVILVAIWKWPGMIEHPEGDCSRGWGRNGKSIRSKVRSNKRNDK